MLIRAACVAVLCCTLVSGADVCDQDVEESAALQVAMDASWNSGFASKLHRRRDRRRALRRQTPRRRVHPSPSPVWKSSHRRRVHPSPSPVWKSSHRRRSLTCSPPPPAFTLPSRGCKTVKASSCLKSNQKYDNFESAWASCLETSGCSYVVRVQSGSHEGYYLRRKRDPIQEQPGAAAMEVSCQPSMCPKYMPANHGHCHHEDLTCKYNEIQCLSGPTVFGITATCKNAYWDVDETPNACPENDKGTCDPNKPEYVSYSLGCRGDISTCLAFNEGFDALNDAWKACGINYECGFITKWTDGKYYLRRDTDPKEETSGASGIIYSCEGQTKDFPAGLLTCKRGTPPSKTSCADPAKLLELNRKIRDHIHAAFNEMPESCTRDSCPRGDLAGCLVRLVGHDIMDFDETSNTGGADGCINFAEPDNVGLKGCMLEAGSEVGVSLEALWQGFCSEISIADFFVITAETLMAAAAPHDDMPLWADSFFKSFRFGRETALTCSPPTLPHPDNACVGVESFFIKRMRLTADQATALMGVHTLGRAKLENTGFDGFWLEPAEGKVFSNKYFQALLAAGWVPQRTPRNQWQWVRSDVSGANEMMLNTDMCLAYQTGEIEPFTRAKEDRNKNCCLWTHKSSPDMAGVDCLCRRQNISVGCTFANCCEPSLRECHGNHVAETFFQINSSEFVNQTAKAVTRYAQRDGGLKAWHTDLMSAWKKTTEQGHDLC